MFKKVSSGSATPFFRAHLEPIADEIFDALEDAGCVPVWADEPSEDDRQMWATQRGIDLDEEYTLGEDDLGAAEFLTMFDLEE